MLSRNVPIRLLPGLSSVFCLLMVSPALAARTDVVELQNGDRITGEVKGLERGILEFKTDQMGTLYIEWKSVARLKSDQLLEVELSSGTRLFGRVAPSLNAGQLQVKGEAQGLGEVVIVDTVRMAPLAESGAVRARLDGYIDFGFSDIKSTDVTQYSFDAGVSFRDRIRLWKFDFSAIQSQSGTADSGSASLKGEQRRFFGNRWFWSGVLEFAQNDELGLDLRTLLGGALGRYLVQNNSHEFALATGLGYAREDLANGSTTDSLEVILGLDYDAFRFSDPELALSTQLVVFPSLTVSGRVRAQASVQLRYELVRDLFTELTLSQTYDSKPQSAGAERNDYTITTSIGYTF